MKFLEMHITNQKLSFEIFRIRNLQNIFMEHNFILMIFGINKRKEDNFDPYNVFLAIATSDWFCGPGSRIDLSITGLNQPRYQHKKTHSA